MSVGVWIVWLVAGGLWLAGTYCAIGDYAELRKAALNHRGETLRPFKRTYRGL